MKKRVKHRMRVRLLVLALVLGLLSSQLSLLASAARVYDKTQNTAFITHKSAKWVDEGNYLAELTLRVNGTQVLAPLDVIIVLDRSGSMDMNYVQADSNGNLTYASCPCLNQEHFYLKPTGITHDAAWKSELTEQVYDEPAQTLTVYNAQDDLWVELDANPDNRVQLYYEFDADTLQYAPYHFKMVDEAFVRISKWDTTDTRSQNYTPDFIGLWDHADEAEDCFDRFAEAKQAVAEFSKTLLEANPANRVALIPFSIRDAGVCSYLNSTNTTSFGVTANNLRDWLLHDEGKYFAPESGITVSSGAISGEYSAQVALGRDLDKIKGTLERLFSTPNTDYIYGLSMAYNMLHERTAQEKEERRAVVVFLSDGKPYSASGTNYANGGNGTVISVANYDENIYTMAELITSDELFVTGTPINKFWELTGDPRYLRNDINPGYLLREGDAIGAPGMGAQLVTVGYMLDKQESYDRLEKMASSPESFIKVTGEQGTTEGYLSECLLNANIFPGGRNSVLRDVVSKYYYVPEDAVLPQGVTIEGSIEAGQTIVWDIGDIYRYDAEKEPSITIPLVLREAYRDVSQTTYYPTNDDNPEPSLYDPSNGPDGPDTGAKLEYTDPDNVERYDTIGTPKLPVDPKGSSGGDKEKEPEEPTPPPEEPKPPVEPIPPEEVPTREHPPTNGDPSQEYVVCDDDGVPLGKWVYQEDEWVFIEEESAPLGDLPRTGAASTGLGILLGGTLLGMGLIIAAYRPRKKQNLPR